MNKQKIKLAQQVRDAIASVPPLKGVKLDVNPQGIFGTDVAGKIWWRVPVVAVPRPRRMTALYEVVAEIEGILQDERGLDILLFIGDPPVIELDETTPQKVEVVVATNPDRDVLTSEMWLNGELIGEIVPVGQKLHIVFGRRRDGQFHELGLEEFEELLQRAKKEALINLEAETPEPALKNGSLNPAAM